MPINVAFSLVDFGYGVPVCIVVLDTVFLHPCVNEEINAGSGILRTSFMYVIENCQLKASSNGIDEEFGRRVRKVIIVIHRLVRE